MFQLWKYCVSHVPVQIWCMKWPLEANRDIDNAQKWVTFTLTWIYMLTQQIWVIFLIVLYCSHLGGMKLGGPGEILHTPKPQTDH